jgi:hypothetical protein
MHPHLAPLFVQAVPGYPTTKYHFTVAVGCRRARAHSDVRYRGSVLRDDSRRLDPTFKQQEASNEAPLQQCGGVFVALLCSCAVSHARSAVYETQQFRKIILDKHFQWLTVRECYLQNWRRK